MTALILWTLGIIYLIVSIIATLVLIGDGKPIWASIIAGLLWGPILIYGLATGRM